MNYIEGNWHCDIIESVLSTYDYEPLYIEIGVRQAISFNRALLHTERAHGVDIEESCYQHMKGGQFYHMPSDEFFERYQEYINAPADVIFIDGEHTYEQVKKDFYNACEVIKETGTIILHDTWPVVKENEAACGTVHKFARELEFESFHRDINVYTFRRFPGVTIVQFLCPSWEN